MTLSVVIITYNEEQNIRRTLESVKWADEIILVDSGSTDRTVAIATEYGAKIFLEEWKGYAAQKNSAIGKAGGDWILSLDADEEVSPELAASLKEALFDSYLLYKSRKETLDAHPQECGLREDFEDAEDDLGRQFGVRGCGDLAGAFIARRNFFLARWIKHGGFYPDYKLRLIQNRMGQFEDRAVHETVKLNGKAGKLRGDLLHHAYPTLSAYLDHMNRYSSLAAEMQARDGKISSSWPMFIVNVIYRPYFNFVWNFIFRGGFLDGREGLLLHLYHNVYVSWKYAKAWEMRRARLG